MKKLAALLLMGTMVFSLGACGSTADDTDITSDDAIGGDPSTWGPELEEEDSTQIPSPFVEYDTIEEAKANIDFDVVVPEQLDGYDETIISVMDGTMFQIIFQNAEKEVCVRKQAGDGDISGDFTEYAEENTVDVNGVSVVMNGASGNVAKATWSLDGYAFSITTDAEMSQDDILQLISQIQ